MLRSAGGEAQSGAVGSLEEKGHRVRGLLAAPDNQMGKDAMTDFGLTAINYMPAQNTGGAGSFSFGQAAATDIDGTARGDA